jgi:hypothetical protein
MKEVEDIERGEARKRETEREKENSDYYDNI